MKPTNEYLSLENLALQPLKVIQQGREQLTEAEKSRIEKTIERLLHVKRRNAFLTMATSELESCTKYWSVEAADERSNLHAKKNIQRTLVLAQIRASLRGILSALKAKKPSCGEQDELMSVIQDALLAKAETSDRIAPFADLFGAHKDPDYNTEPFGNSRTTETNGALSPDELDIVGDSERSGMRS